MNLSAYYASARESQSNLEAVSQAIDILEVLWTEEKEPEIARMLGGSYSGRAIQKSWLGNVDGCLSDTRRGAGVLREALRIWPGDGRILSELSTVYRRGQRIDFVLRGVEVGGEMAKRAQPSRAEAGEAQVAAMRNAANVLAERSGRPDFAVRLLREGREINRRNMRSAGRGGLNEAYINGFLGENLVFGGKMRDGTHILEELDSERDEYPSGDHSAQWNKIWFRSVLGWAEGERGDIAKGLESCRAAQSEFAAFLARDKPLRPVLGDSLWNDQAFARLRSLSKRIGLNEWIAEQRRIVAERRRIAAEPPRMSSFESETNASIAFLAGILHAAGRPEEGLATVEGVLPDQERLIAEDHIDKPEYPEMDLRNYAFRQVLAELLSNKAEALAKLGKPAEASKAIRRAIEVIEPFTKPEPCYLYDLARYLTLASTFPDKAGIPDAAERAVRALQQFIASGFDNPYKLIHDDRLAPLRDRADFQVMVRALEAKMKAEATKK
jgi:tetratricopeptide (TPR) repeat protein